MILNEEYLANDALSQSRLKKLLIHPQMFLNANNDTEVEEPRETTTIGDAVDLILTQSDEAFHDSFYITNVERPGAMMGTFVWELYSNRENSDAFQIAYEASGFKIKQDKVMERFEKEGKTYYEALLESDGKVTITTSQYNKIVAIVDSLRQNQFTSKWIMGSNTLDVHKQVVVEFEYLGCKCKGLLDLIVVDKETRTMYPIDLKTSSSSTNYWSNMFWKFRYDIQAAFYTEGIVQSVLVKEYNCKRLNPFRFIVENQSFPGNPLIYQISDDVLEIGTKGGTYMNNKYEGFHQAILRYKWHKETDLWEYTREDYLNNGIRTI